uniref:Uncharacterized protein n=1 Tax=Poecilia mexicana TaxID=48701 RepID=A0A3B3YZ56_9TELE
MKPLVHASNPKQPPISLLSQLFLMKSQSNPLKHPMPPLSPHNVSGVTGVLNLNPEILAILTKHKEHCCMFDFFFPLYF